MVFGFYPPPSDKILIRFRRSAVILHCQWLVSKEYFLSAHKHPHMIEARTDWMSVRAFSMFIFLSADP